MGEPAIDGEIRDPQERPGVDPAGAGRKIECLPREVCHSAKELAIHAVVCEDEVTEVSTGHSTRRGEGPNSKT